MKGFALCLMGCLLLVAGCAQHRNSNPDIAPSLQASRMTPPDSGWSVPPGQKAVRDPASAQAYPSNEQASRMNPRRGSAESTLRPEAAAHTARNGKAPTLGEKIDTAKRDLWPAVIAPFAGIKPGPDAPSVAARREREAGVPGDKTPAAPENAARTDSLAPDMRASLPLPQRVVATPLEKPLVPAVPISARNENGGRLHTAHFAFDSHALNPQAEAILAANAEWILKHPEAMIRVEGHADERGSSEYNLALGARRAQMARDFLIAKGVSSKNLIVVSFGEELPLVVGKDAKSHAVNRRTEFTLTTAQNFSAMHAQPSRRQIKR